MGNCLFLREKVARERKTDGKILEYKPPIKVHQVLPEFSHHAISDAVVKHMHPKKKSVVRFSDDALEDGGGMVRIKIVIAKKELQRMISAGEVLVGGMNPTLQIEKCRDEAENDEGDSRGWSPALECIPEVD